MIRYRQCVQLAHNRHTRPRSSRIEHGLHTRNGDIRMVGNSELRQPLVNHSGGLKLLVPRLRVPQDTVGNAGDRIELRVYRLTQHLLELRWRRSVRCSHHVSP